MAAQEEGGAPARGGSVGRKDSAPAAPAREAPECLRGDRTLNEYVVDPAEADGVMFFLHGALSNLHVWDAQLRHFSKRKQRLRVVAWDAYGCGDSDKPDTWKAYDEEELLQDARAMWDKYYMEGKRNVIVGHSFGSALAVRLACDAAVTPHVGGLCLLGVSPLKPAEADSWLFRMPNWTMSCVRGNVDKAFIDKAFHKSSSEDLKALALQQATHNPWHVIKAFYRQLQWDLGTLWGRLRMPLLLITGASDGICPFAGARKAFDLVAAARLGVSITALNERPDAPPPRRLSSATDMAQGPTRRPSIAGPGRPSRAGSAMRKGSSLRRQGGGSTTMVSVVTARVQEVLVKGYTCCKGRVQLAAVGSASHQVMQEQARVVNILVDTWMREYALLRSSSGKVVNGAAPAGAMAGALTGSAGGPLAPVTSGDAATAQALMSSGMGLGGGAGGGGSPDFRRRTGSVVSNLSAAMLDSDTESDDEDGFERQLRAENTQLQGQVSTLRASGGGAGGEGSAEVERRAAALQEELTAVYRREAETSREHLKVAGEVQSLRKELQVLKDSQELHQARLTSAEAKAESLASALASSEGEVEVLREELTAVRQSLSRAEEEKSAVQADHDKLVQRLVAERAKATADIAALRAELAAAAGTSGAGSAFRGAAAEGADADGEDAGAGLADEGEGGWEVVSETGIPSQARQVVPAHEKGINALAFSETSAIVASASSDGTVGLWDAVTAKRRGTLRGGDAAGAVMCVHVAGGVAAGGTSSRVVHVWDLSTERVRVNLTGHAGKVYGVQFVNGGRTLVTASTDRTVKIWDLAGGGQCVRTIDGRSIVNCMAVSRDGGAIVTGHQNSMVAVWDARTGAKMAENRAQHAAAITDVQLSTSADGHAYILTMSKDNTLALLDGRTLDCMHSEGSGSPRAHRGTSGPAAASATSSTAPPRDSGRSSWGFSSLLSSMTGSPSPAQTRLPVTSSAAAVGGGGPSPSADHVRGPNMKSTAFRVAFNWSDAALSPRPVPAATVEAAAGRTGAAAAAAPGVPHYLAAAGGSDGSVFLWDVATRWPVAVLGKAHASPVASVAFSGDARRLVSGDGAGVLAFWQ